MSAAAALSPDDTAKAGDRNSSALPKVLHFIYDTPSNPWVGGGGSVRVHELYRRLVRRVDATVVTGNFPGARNEVIDGVSYRRLGSAAPYAWSRVTYAASANRMLRTASYDAALFDFSGYTPLFMPAGRPTGIVLHHLTSPTAHMRWGGVLSKMIGQLEKTMLRRATRISATSISSREAAEKIAPATPVDTVSAGVPEELFEIRRRPQDFLLYFGRLDIFHKGIDTLLQAVQLMAKRRPPLELRIAGRGSSAEKIKAMIAELGVEHNVKLLGAVSDAERNELLATAAVQLMPSRFEGFGLAAAEAMAAGVPLVAAAVGSLPEVVDAPRGGVLVPPDDPQALASATEKLLDDPYARSNLSITARESARRFSWSAVAEAHLQFINHVVAGGRSKTQASQQ
ncbi:MAG: glycosyltransferase family 4 protein [Gemmatimonadaceae bacterium]